MVVDRGRPPAHDHGGAQSFLKKNALALAPRVPHMHPQSTRPTAITRARWRTYFRLSGRCGRWKW